MTEPPVLVVTSLGDATADLVLGELHARDAPVVRLDPGTDFDADAPRPTAAPVSARVPKRNSSMAQP
ncbi:hypothetical protein [Streptomyces sp. NPDC003032]